MKLILSLTCLLLSVHFQLKAQNFLWARGSSCTNPNIGAESFIVKTDLAGNVYIAGYAENLSTVYSGTFNIGTQTLSVPTYQYLVFAKFDSSGNLLWVSHSSESSAEPVDIAIDKDGNSYVYGLTYADSFAIGSVWIHNTYNVFHPYFIIKYDRFGNVVWTTTGGGTALANFGFSGSIIVDSNNNIYITGTFSDPTFRAGSFVLNNFSTIVPSPNTYLVKYDSSSNVLWAKSFGRSAGVSLAISKTGAKYLAGTYPLNITLGNITLNNNSGFYRNIFLCNFDDTGNVIWANGYPANKVSGIVVDTKGFIYLLTDFTGASLLLGSLLITSIGPNATILLAKFDSSGNPVWGKTSGADSTVHEYAVTTDICDNAWITGAITKNIILGGDTISRPQGSTDPIFVAEYNPTGVLKEHFVLPSGGDDKNGITADNFGHIYLGGDYIGPTFTLKNLTLSSGNNENIFVAKYLPQPPVPDTSFEHIDTSLCATGHLQFVAPAGYTSYLWNNGSNDSFLTIGDTGTFWVFCNTYSCSPISLIDTFSVNNKGLQFSLGLDTTICMGQTLLLNAPLSNASYQWQNGSTDSSFLVSSAGLYTLSINKNKCSTSAGIEVGMVDITQHLSDTIFCDEQPIQLSVNANVPSSYSALWSTGNTSTSLLISDTGTYYVTVTNGNCSAYDTMHVAGEHCDCWVKLPGAFSPNNDTKNDKFRPIFQPDCQMTDYYIKIFDRWGAEIFSANELSKSWDGKYPNGNLAEIGTYMYQLQYQSGKIHQKHVVKGDVTLIR